MGTKGMSIATLTKTNSLTALACTAWRRVAILIGCERNSSAFMSCKFTIKF